ncbi:MAG: hypothetical protein M1825_006158 [Sarcosagium campestre]|nr:MAG: hypothetical protein M1825_006158 [Sarcosagium campestre]
MSDPNYPYPYGNHYGGHNSRRPPPPESPVSPNDDYGPPLANQGRRVSPNYRDGGPPLGPSNYQGYYDPIYPQGQPPYWQLQQQFVGRNGFPNTMPMEDPSRSSGMAPTGGVYNDRSGRHPHPDHVQHPSPNPSRSENPNEGGGGRGGRGGGGGRSRGMYNPGAPFRQQQTRQQQPSYDPLPRAQPPPSLEIPISCTRDCPEGLHGAQGLPSPDHLFDHLRRSHGLAGSSLEQVAHALCYSSTSGGGGDDDDIEEADEDGGDIGPASGYPSRRPVREATIPPDQFDNSSGTREYYTIVEGENGVRYWELNPRIMATPDYPRTIPIDD